MRAPNPWAIAPPDADYITGSDYSAKGLPNSIAIGSLTVPIGVNDDVSITWGSATGGDVVSEWSTAQTNDAFLFGMGASNSFILTTKANVTSAADLTRGADSHPTIVGTSATAWGSATDEWWAIWHDGSNAYLDTGKGAFYIQDEVYSTTHLHFGDNDTIFKGGGDDSLELFDGTDHLWTFASLSTADADGGDWRVTAQAGGTGGTGNHAGGDIDLIVGLKAGSGADGLVNLQGGVNVWDRSKTANTNILLDAALTTALTGTIATGSALTNGLTMVTAAGDVAVGTNTTGNNFRVRATEGADSVLNGDFASDLSDWTAGAGWSWSTGTALHTAGNTATLYPAVSLAPTAGNSYKVVFTVSGRTAGSLSMTFGGVLGTIRDADGTYTSYVVASSTGNLIFTPTTDFDGAIDNVSVQQITNGTCTVEGISTASGRIILESGSAYAPAIVWGTDSYKLGIYRHGGQVIAMSDSGNMRHYFTNAEYMIPSDTGTIKLGATTFFKIHRTATEARLDFGTSISAGLALSWVGADLLKLDNSSVAEFTATAAAGTATYWRAESGADNAAGTGYAGAAMYWKAGQGGDATAGDNDGGAGGDFIFEPGAGGALSGTGTVGAAGVFSVKDPGSADTIDFYHDGTKGYLTATGWMQIDIATLMADGINMGFGTGADWGLKNVVASPANHLELLEGIIPALAFYGSTLVAQGFAAASNTPGNDIFIASQTAGTHVDANPRGGNIAIELGAGTGTGVQGILSCNGPTTITPATAAVGLAVDMAANAAEGITINTEAAANAALSITAKYGLYVNQDVSVGYAGYFYRNLAEAGVDSVLKVVDDATATTQHAFSVRSDSSTVTTACAQLLRNGITTTSTDGLLIENSTAALVGVTVEMSPRWRQRGRAWDTDDAVERTVDWIGEVLPVTGNTVTSLYRWGHSLDGAAYTYPMTLTNAGVLSISTIASAAGATVLSTTTSTLNAAGNDTTLTVQSRTFSGTDSAIEACTGEVTVGNGETYVGMHIHPKHSHGATTAAASDLVVSRWENSVGSGAQLLMDLGTTTDGTYASHTSKFSVTNNGYVNMADASQIRTGIVDNDYFTFHAVDNDDQSLKEVARVSGAAGAIQYFSFGGSQQYKFQNDGTTDFAGNVTMNNAAGPVIINAAATTTVPTLCPNKAETDTGIGWASDTIHMVGGGSTLGSFGSTGLLVTGGLGTNGESVQAQAAHIADSAGDDAAAVNAILVVLENVGLIAKT